MNKFANNKRFIKKLPKGIFGDRLVILGLLLWLAMPPSAAESPPAGPRGCAKEADPTLRLACYDRRFPPVPIASERAAVSPAQLPSSSALSPSARADQPPPARQASPAELRVAELSTTSRGRSLIALEDGSLWLQRDDRPLSLSPGDAVFIRSGLLGSQYLRPASGEGRSAKVERLR